MKHLVSLSLIFILALAAQAQPKRVTAEKITAETCTLIVIDAGSAKGNVAFFFSDAKVFDPKHSRQEGKKIFCVVTTPGEYTINIVLWQEQQIETVLLVVTGPGPAPGPGPGPGPDPGPKDPLYDVLKEQFDKETDPYRATQAVKLAECWEAVLGIVDGAVTWGELSARLIAESKNRGVSGKLPKVAAEIAQIMTIQGFPASPSVLMTTEDRVVARTTIEAVSKTLRRLK